MPTINKTRIWIVILVMFVMLLAGCDRTYEHIGVVSSVKYERATFSDSSYTTISFEDGMIIRVIGTLNGLALGHRYRIVYVRLTTLLGQQFWRCSEMETVE